MPFKLDKSKPQSIISKSHKDHHIQHKELCKTISELLNEFHHEMMNKTTKVKQLDLIYMWLSKNTYLFENERFREVVQMKLDEFERDDMGIQITNKYRWMLNIHPPVQKYSSFGRIIKPTHTNTN